jgi:hypothetical protein
MKTKSFFFSIVILLAIIACEETDAPVLEGDIHGTVSLNDAYGFPMSDKSNVQVQLTGEDTELETTTDSYGRYMFQDLPFGKYYINLNKENYIEADRNFSVDHIGGNAPTSSSMVMNEIPEYYYGIDSMTQYPPYSNFNIYMHVIGATKTFKEYTNFYVHCFFSQSPDVSCENYENSFMWITSSHAALYFTFWYGTNHFLNDYTGTVYCRIYAQAYYYDIWEGATSNPHPIYQETLGPPSEVFSFTVEGITRTNPDY